MAIYTRGVNLAVAIALFGCLMSGNCYICPNDCDTCIDDNMCSNCTNPGYYVHNHTCVKCAEKCLSCTSNTECTYCTKGFYGKTQCLQECSDKCIDGDCDINGRCKSCVDGMYGDNCNIECGQNCTICDSSTGGCLSCETGTFLYNNECKRCSTSCTQCTSALCTECVVGKWGKICEKVCSNCKPETPCRKGDGVCDSCVDGMSGYWCNTLCSPECLSCDRFSFKTCTACVANKYDTITHCNNDCSPNCLNSTCDDITEECTFGCINGYYGRRCTCPPNCYCFDYNNNNKCSYCKNGFGNTNQNCKCTNENCVNNDCFACTSLKYFVYDKTCCSCRVEVTNCEECTTHANGDFSGCTKCDTGFFPYSNKCYACSPLCNDTICDPVTGACTLGCNGPLWGAQCKTYGSRCTQCDQQNGTCTVCQQGNYSPDCSKSCSHACKTLGDLPTCAILDGACIYGCQSTKVHGSHCQHSCSINCTDELCDWQTARCLFGCTDNHYGNVCNNTCSQTCSTPKTGYRCYDTNGTCLNGCKVGYYGEMCENQCSPNCVNTTCEQFTGSCLHGCRGRYEGDDCMMALSQAEAMTGTIAGCVTGLIVLCLIMFVIVALVWRRRHHKDDTGSSREFVTYDTPQGVEADDAEDNYNAMDTTEANEIVEYEQIDGETNLPEAGSEYLPMDGEVAGRYM